MQRKSLQQAVSGPPVLQALFGLTRSAACDYFFTGFFKL
jgi:hypothetical protein